MRTPAIFFDRDDTIMKNVPYLGDPALVEVYPGAGEVLGRLSQNFVLFVISNQSGVGRGLITVQQVQSVYEEMNRKLGKNHFQSIYNCYAEPEQTEAFERKPSPQLVYLAAREYGLDLRNSFFVGDRLTDILAGRNAGCRTILVLSGHSKEERPLSLKLADHVAEDLAEVEAIINQQTK